MNNKEAFANMKGFLADAIEGFMRKLREDRMRVAIVTFADTVQIVFDFDDYLVQSSSTRAEIFAKLDTIVYPDWGNEESQSNIAKAFEVVRTVLFTPRRGHTDGVRKKVIVALTDGHVRVDPARTLGCDTSASHEECGATLLAAELAQETYSVHMVARWVFAPRPSVFAHASLIAYRAAQQDAIVAGSEVYLGEDAQNREVLSGDPAVARQFSDYMVYSPMMQLSLIHI